MSSDQLPSDFAPYHLVRTDGPVAQGAGKFYDLGICASTLDFLRGRFPEHEWQILSDGGVIDDSKIVRKPLPACPTDLVSRTIITLLRRAA